jgi:hypothetical protein
MLGRTWKEIKEETGVIMKNNILKNTSRRQK